MKKAVVAIGLFISGVIGVSAQRIIDSIFTANNWQLSQAGVNLPYLISWLAILIGALLAALALKGPKSDR